MNATQRTRQAETVSLWGSLYNPKSKEYTVDDIIDAYQEGHRMGLLFTTQKIKKELRDNLIKYLPLVENFFNSLNEKGQLGKLIVMRVSDVNYFEFIIAVDKDAYVDDNVCRPIYKQASDIEKQNRGLHISFMPYSGSLNTKGLIADNYLVYYGDPQ